MQDVQQKIGSRIRALRKRSGITVGEIGRDSVLFFGDSAGYVYALDCVTGKQLWKVPADEHPASTVTATPVFHQGHLYVGSASREEALSVSPSYPCCTFRGSEMAIDAATGKVLWKRYIAWRRDQLPTL